MILPPKFDDSCVLWFDFASVKNNTVYDQSKYHNDGKVYGAQHIGRFGLHGLHFDGVDDYVDCGNDASLNMIEEVTVIALANAFTATDEDLRVVSKGEWGGNYDLYWYRNAFWVFDAKFSDDNTYNISSAGHTELNTLNIPHFLAGVVKDAEIDLIVDTTKITRAIPSGLNLVTNDKPLKIGAFYSYFNGNIYFVALYNRALSDAEIRELYYYLTKGIRSIVPSRFVARATR